MKNTRNLLCGTLVMALLLTGCSAAEAPASSERNLTEELTEAVATEAPAAANTDTSTNSSTAENSMTNVSVITNPDAPYSIDPASLFTERDFRAEYTADTFITLNGDSAEAEGSGVVIDGSTVTITAEGVYAISGTLTDGQIIVNAEGGKVQLVLANAEINCSYAPAIDIENAKKTFLTLESGTVNSVSDGTSYTDQSEGAPNAAIYSKDTLTINGSGTLHVSANYQDGITSKDDLVITGGIIDITAVGDGIKGKDYIAMADGSLTIQAGSDGMKATNSTDEGMGFVYICGGTLDITAAEDGIQAETEFVAEGGTFQITSGGGTSNAKAHTGDMMPGGFGGGFGGQGGNFDNQSGEMRGRGRMNNQQDTAAAAENTGTPVLMQTANFLTAEAESAADTSSDETSVKGIKAGTLLYISGGTFDLQTAGDGLHSNGNLSIAGGTLTIASGNKGIHADTSVEISEGTLTVAESYEGIEATDILVSGGVVSVTSSDDGFNASDGSDEGARGQAVSCTLEISGGSVYVNADGDGLDSNGDMLISGGIVLVDGPTNSGNGALDSNSSLKCTGGLLIAAGASGMAEYPTGDQETIVLTTATSYEGGTLVTICDADGNEVLSYEPSKSWNSFIVSSSVLASGQTYTAYIGGTSTASSENGLYEVGGYQNDGAEEGTVTLDDAVAYIGTTGSMGGGFGGGQRGGFNQGGDMQLPTDENGETVNPFADGNFQPGDMPQGDFRPDDMQFPTDEDGNPVQPEGGFGGGRGMKGRHGGMTDGGEGFMPDAQNAQQS